MSIKVAQIVTDRINALLAAGTVPWRKPWKNGTKPSNIDGRAYNGINFFLLSCLGYETPVYLTMNQIKKMNGRIKAGQEKLHHPVFFWKWLEDRNDPTSDRKIPLARYTLVWNIEQIDGIELPKRFKAEAKVFNTIEAAEKVVAGYQDGPEIRHGGDRACYTPVTDKVQMPPRENFESPNEYYATLFHELGHSTGHRSRLNRKELMDATFFGSHSYSVEELCAEMTAAFLSAHTGIDDKHENSAAYIQSWMEALKDKPTMLMQAAGRAQKAFARIVGVTEEPEAENA